MGSATQHSRISRPLAVGWSNNEMVISFGLRSVDVVRNHNVAAGSIQLRI